MHHAYTSALIATAYFALRGSALPAPQPAATYQVVNVAGPSSNTDAETIYATVTAPSAPETVTKSATTVTVSKTSLDTTTKTCTSTVEQTYAAVSTATPYTETSSTSLPVVTQTSTLVVYEPVPVPSYLSTSTSLSTSTTTPTSLKSAFPTSYGQWNYTVASNGPTGASTISATSTTGRAVPNVYGAPSWNATRLH